MKFFGLSLCLLAVAAAAPAILTPLDAAGLAVRRSLPALDHEEIHDEFGQYALRYVTAEGTVVSERGRLVPTPDGTGYVMVFEGEVSYIGDDGQTYITKYTAGLDGYNAEVNQLPVPAVPVSVPVAPEIVSVVPEGIAIVPEPVSVVTRPIIPGPAPILPEKISVVPEPVPVIAETDKVIAEVVPVVAETNPTAAETIKVIIDPAPVVPETIKIIVEPTH